MISEELKKEMKQEAIERLKILEEKGQVKNVLKEYKEDETLYYTENTRLGGILYWVDNKEELVQAVKEVEEKYDILVYFAIETMTEFGRLFDMLYISEDKETWEEDKQELRNGYAMSYCKNFDDEMCSEFGEIAIRVISGGAVRTL